MSTENLTACPKCGDNNWHRHWYDINETRPPVAGRKISAKSADYEYMVTSCLTCGYATENRVGYAEHRLTSPIALNPCWKCGIEPVYQRTEGTNNFVTIQCPKCNSHVCGLPSSTSETWNSFNKKPVELARPVPCYKDRCVHSVITVHRESLRSGYTVGCSCGNTTTAMPTVELALEQWRVLNDTMTGWFDRISKQPTARLEVMPDPMHSFEPGSKICLPETLRIGIVYSNPINGDESLEFVGVPPLLLDLIARYFGHDRYVKIRTIVSNFAEKDKERQTTAQRSNHALLTLQSIQDVIKGLQ